ncbi:DUF4430 domain-containing protein [Paenibacillus sp. LPE1-1-1.1]
MMAKNSKRWLFSLLIGLLVIGAIVGCANPETNGNTASEQTPASQAPQETAVTDDKGSIEPKGGSESAQPANSSPTAEPKATPSAVADKDEDENPVKDAASEKPAASVKPAKPTLSPVQGDQQVTPSPKPNASEKPVQSPSASPAETKQPISSVTISIVADEKTGTVLAATAVELQKDDTVLEVLKRTTRKNKIQMEYRGVKAAAYIEGIDNLYEFDLGAKSGWMYRVNGEFPNKSAGAFKLKDGDVIEWLYTIDLGEDLGAEAE